MDFPQSTLAEIMESEAQMVRTAEARFGNYYVLAWDCSLLLSNCIVSVNHGHLNFARFHCLLKKHHTLAVLSAVRLHKVQAMMNLRQALEAGAAAAFAIANPADDNFFTVDQNGNISSSQKLAVKRYRWLETNYKTRSDVIKWKKDMINDTQSHANIVSSESIFRIDNTRQLINAPFFDIEDDFHVKTDLWLASSIALELMDWFYGIKHRHGADNAIEFAPEFPAHVQELAARANALQDEMMATERYQKAMARISAQTA
jgi:hypothetical protein